MKKMIEEYKRTKKQSTGSAISPTKGDLTKSLILDAALYLAGRDGFEGLTIGLIAKRLQMSKSGVYAHFESKENLQIEVIKEYHRRFRSAVFEPAMTHPRGLPRLKKMLELWTEQTISELSSGCIYISGAFELDDRPGPVREELVLIVNTWRETLVRAMEMAIEVGHLNSKTKPIDMLFAVYSFMLGLQHDARFLRKMSSVDVAKRHIREILDLNKPNSESK